MSVSVAIKEAERHGVKIALNAAGDGLELTADREPPDEILAKLKARKPEIIALLRQASLATCPKGYSQQEWLAAVADARRLGYPPGGRLQ